MSILKNYQPAKGTCKVTFSYPNQAAEGCKTVQILGDFNNWDSKVAPAMKAGKNEFSATLELAVGQTYEFKYLLDGTKWDNDHSSDSYVASPFSGINNSVLILDATNAPISKAAPKAKAVPVAKVAKTASKASSKLVTATKTTEKVVAKKVVAKKPAAKKAVAKKATPVAKVAKPVVVKETVTAETKVAAVVTPKSKTNTAPKAKTPAKKATK